MNMSTPKIKKTASQNRYQALIAEIFSNHYANGVTEFEFARSEIEDAALKLDFPSPKNIGDVLYSVRYRNSLPQSILNCTPVGYEWIIQGAGRAAYRFKLALISRILPRHDLLTIKIPDATPEIISAYALSDEQALLARIRYNRLMDVFLGITTYSLQNHLRTTVAGVGQIEIDEIYVGVDKFGRQFVIPVQAKGGTDKHGVVQTQQDIACCREKFPHLICRPISAQFMNDQRIALFELTLQNEEIRVVEERHYELLPASSITHADLSLYNNAARTTP
jgi:hypothetical protein